jgi:hypothetical protein
LEARKAVEQDGNGAALLPDGRIDAAADRQLAVTVDPVLAAGRPGRSEKVTSAAPAAVPGAIVDFEASRTLLRSKAVLAAVAAERARRSLNAERGRFVLTAQAEAEWTRTPGEFITNIEGGFLDLAEALGGDRRNLIVIKKWWRAIRASEAERNRQQAASLPEYTAADEAI